MPLLLTILFVWFLAPHDDAPPLGQIIPRAIEARKTQNEKGWKFTWREEDEYRDEQDRPLKPFYRTFDIVMLEGDNYRKLVLLDGQPLDAAMQNKVDEDMAKDRELRRKHSFLNKKVPFGSLEQLERLFNNKVSGEEIIADVRHGGSSRSLSAERRPPTS